MQSTCLSSTTAFLLVSALMAGALPAGANTGPVAVADSVETHARQAILIDLLANDEEADGDPLTVSLTGSPTRGSLLDQGDGTVTYTPDPALFEGSGGDSFAYTIDDGRGGLASATVTIGEIPVPPEMVPLTPPIVPLEDGFDDGDMVGWTIVPNTPEAQAAWTASAGFVAQSSNIGSPGTWAVFDAGSTWTDYRYEASMWSADDDAMGLIFRYVDPDNFYVVYWSNFFGSLQLYRVEAGVWNVLASTGGTYRGMDPYRVEIAAEGSRIQVSVDGSPTFDLTDSAFVQGTIGLFSGHNVGTFFDDLRVTQLPEESPPTLLDDNFDDGDFEGWTIGDSGRSAFPSFWQVSAGELVQTSNIFNSPFVGVASTVAVFDDGDSWTDYRFRAKVNPKDDDSVAFYFRFQDWQNHYAFHWNQQMNVRLLRKMVNGSFVDLARESGGYTSLNAYLVELVADGEFLEVWIDGHRVFAVQDDGLQGGTVGLAAEGMTTVHFDNVRVTAIP